MGLANKTVTDCNNYMREVYVHRLLCREKKKIGVPGKYMEIGEILFPKWRNQVSRLLLEHWFFGWIFIDTNERSVVHIPNRKTTTL